MKKQQLALLIMFLALLILPTILFPLVGGFIDTENHENRELALFPKISEVGFDFSKAFDKYYTDQLPFKNQFTELHSKVFLSLFNTTSNPRTIVGKEGWLFYNNYGLDNPIDDILGKSTFSEAELEQIADNLSVAKDKFTQQEQEFLFLLPPNKEAIYTELLPEYLIEKSSFQSRVDLLADYLKKQNIDIVYPKQALLDAKESHQVYYKYDTHWNKLGGYVGFSEVCKQLGMKIPNLDTLQISLSNEFPKDLADLAGIQNNCNDDADYFPINIFDNINVVHAEENEAGTFNRYTSNAKDNRTVLLIHDSYYQSMIDYMPMVFSEVISVHRDYADLYAAQELIAKYNCDIIIMEVVERGATILLHDNMPY